MTLRFTPGGLVTGVVGVGSGVGLVFGGSPVGFVPGVGEGP